MAEWRSNIPALKAVLQRAEAQGLVAAAAIVTNRVRQGMRGGFTSGDFVTGRSMSSVTQTLPQRDAVGAYIKVGTNVMYDLYWEVGHWNIFTRRFERVEIWMPALLDTRQQQKLAFWRVFDRSLRSMGKLGRGYLHDVKASGGLDSSVNQQLADA